MKDFLSIDQLGQGELFGLLDLAVAQREALAAGRLEPCLSGRVLAMLFSKPSLRTRVSFEVAMLQLGGHALYLSPAEVGLGSRESVADVARVLSRYADAIMARVFAHADVVGLAQHASVPVINGLSDYNHPCQGLADLLTIRDAFGRLSGLKLVYLGDGNNVAHSLLIGGALAGMSVSVLHPPGYAPLDSVMQLAAGLAAAAGGEVSAGSDLAAADGADVLYTDVWASMGQEEEAAARKTHFADYRLDEGRLERASEGCIVLHCLPAHRGDEITDGAIDGPQSRVFAQAENRLHAQRALLSWLVGGVAL